VNERVADEGLVSREADEEQPAQDDTASTETEPMTELEKGETEAENDDEAERTIEIDEDVVAELSKAVLGSQVFTDFSAKLDTLVAQFGKITETQELLGRSVGEVEKRLSDVERDEEDKKTEWQQDLPARQKVIVSYRPRNRGATQEGDDQVTSTDIAKQTLEGLKL